MMLEFGSGANKKQIERSAEILFSTPVNLVSYFENSNHRLFFEKRGLFAKGNFNRLFEILKLVTKSLRTRKLKKEQ